MAEKKFELKRPERRVEICLDGSLVSEYEAVQAELEDARRNAISDRRLNNDAVNKLEIRSAELYKAQEESTLVFTLRALPRATWAGIKEANPPRDDNNVDESLGYNVNEVVAKAMLTEGTIARVEQQGEPVEFTTEDWAGIVDDLSDGQWQEVQTAVASANGGRPQVPFSQSGFKLMQDSAKNSK
ncbi:hypothetical protein ACLQ8T_05820 [Glutamicibacter sp. FR1]|uniref:hypothetical protein n=1 Tax=Glutamicibacter sp. FR1 TaxID=3393744 RepID=UPI0039B0EA95